MIVIKLKEVKLAHERRVGARCTWDDLSLLIGIPKDTLVAMANRQGYNTTLEKINMICAAMGVAVEDVLEYRLDTTSRSGAARKRTKKKAGKKTAKKKAKKKT